MALRTQALRPWLISGCTFVADQLTKALVASTVSPHESLPLLPPVMYLTYVQNTGAAFGLFKGQQLLFIVLSVLVIGWLAWEFLTRPAMPRLTLWASALVMGGATGNLIDRMRLGYVVDFIDLRKWPVFNLGDSAITMGVTLLIWQSLFGHQANVPARAGKP